MTVDLQSTDLQFDSNQTELISNESEETFA